MEAFIKYIIFAVLMIVALIFSVHGDMLLGTLFLVITAVFALIFLGRDDNDGNIYKLT